MMKGLLFSASLFLLMASCSNDKGSASASKPFCDTTCNDQDTFKFASGHKLHPFVKISVKNCSGDTVTWGHDRLPADRQIHMSTFLGKQVRLNSTAMECFIQDTSHAWLSFNDCITGRGYALKLPFNKSGTLFKVASALNSFDPKFVVEKGLKAYSDRSMVYVEDMVTEKTQQMTYKEKYEIDFDRIHESIDSVNISRTRIFVQLIKNGQKVPLEKTISL